MEFTDALAECLAQYKTKKEFCEEWGIGAQTLRDWLKGNTPLPISRTLVFTIYEVLTLREALRREEDACFNCHLRIKG